MHRRLCEEARDGAALPFGEGVVELGGVVRVVTNVYTGRESTISRIERMVGCNATEACDELTNALREEGLRVLTASDCVPTRVVDVAMAEGTLAARDI